MKAQQLGRQGEEIACKALKKRGYKIIDRNVTSPGGEIDLVARQGGAIVFVEVKTRTSDQFGPPQEAVTPDKQRRLTRLALEWLAGNGLSEASARFDVVSIRLDQGKDGRVEIVRNAFEARE